ncbi:TIR domain-containing protein [Phenylobacterium sp.]|uniref:TIR domain-containing protein n=1 Tax=Phenylobacterium sp. TaxID=1871053 RepID=UPI0025F81FDA|nr:TIR domain-containing protein [Phenylobacterium sp.]
MDEALMAYRNGTYIAFHAEGKTDPTASDIKYYRTLKMWHASDGTDFKFVNSHDKVAAVRDGSKAETIKRSLRERLDNSKNMVLIIGPTTKLDTDFVPYEIAYAVDRCGIPIIATYTSTGYTVIREPKALSAWWPAALSSRIANGTASVIHIPFKQAAIDCAIGQFSHNSLPLGGGLGIYSDAAYREFGLL